MRWAVPVEVIPFGWGSQAVYLRSLKAALQVRKNPDGSFFKTDQGNLILDCNFGPIHDPSWLASQLNGRAGIVQHGLFIGMASDVIVAGVDGCRHLRRGTI
jgi:ribose 5-phosphate isomerase A